MEKIRLFFIDNLRILLITLIMMIHLSITYGGEGSWYYRDGQADTLSSILLTWHNAAVQAFSMGLLFMIAGYFTPGSYDRKGPRQYLKDRLLRLGIPMLCYDFIIGIVAYRHNWLTRISGPMGRLWLCLAIISIVIVFPALFVLGGAIKGNIDAFTGGLHWQCFTYALWEQFTGVALIITLLALFHKRLNRQGKLTRAMSGSAYTAYIIHAPVIILVAIAIRNISLYPLLKFVLAVLISVPLCFGIGNIIRKLPLARRILALDVWRQRRKADFIQHALGIDIGLDPEPAPALICLFEQYGLAEIGFLPVFKIKLVARF